MLAVSSAGSGLDLVSGALFRISLLAAICLFCSSDSAAQSAAEAEFPTDAVVLSKLSPPVYPPLARQARIVGAVALTVRVRADGTVESVDAISGHPMMIQAAENSARQSLFTCSNCSGTTSHSLTYDFQLAEQDIEHPCAVDRDTPQQPPEVRLTSHKVTVTSWSPWICDPPMQLEKVRSAKCLYLWKCETRYPL